MRRKKQNPFWAGPLLLCSVHAPRVCVWVPRGTPVSCPFPAEPPRLRCRPLSERGLCVWAALPRRASWAGWAPAGRPALPGGTPGARDPEAEYVDFGKYLSHLFLLIFLKCARSSRLFPCLLFGVFIPKC